MVGHAVSMARAGRNTNTRGVRLKDLRGRSPSLPNQRTLAPRLSGNLDDLSYMPISER